MSFPLFKQIPQVEFAMRTIGRIEVVLKIFVELNIYINVTVEFESKPK